MCSLGFLVVIWAEELSAMIVADPEVIRLSTTFLYMLAIVQPLLAVDFALGGALRGAGDTRFPMYSTLCSFLGVRVVLAFIFSLLGLSVEWVFGALIADYLLKASLLAWRFRSRRWLKVLVRSNDSSTG